MITWSLNTKTELHYYSQKPTLVPLIAAIVGLLWVRSAICRRMLLSSLIRVKKFCFYVGLYTFFQQFQTNYTKNSRPLIKKNYNLFKTELSNQHSHCAEKTSGRHGCMQFFFSHFHVVCNGQIFKCYNL